MLYYFYCSYSGVNNRFYQSARGKNDIALIIEVENNVMCLAELYVTPGKQLDNDICSISLTAFFFILKNFSVSFDGYVVNIYTFSLPLL